MAGRTEELIRLYGELPDMAWRGVDFLNRHVIRVGSPRDTLDSFRPRLVAEAHLLKMVYSSKPAGYKILPFPTDSDGTPLLKEGIEVFLEVLGWYSDQYLFKNSDLLKLPKAGQLQMTVMDANWWWMAVACLGDVFPDRFEWRLPQPNVTPRTTGLG